MAIAIIDWSACLKTIPKFRIKMFAEGLTNSLHGLWNPEVQSRIHKGYPIIPILSRINPIPPINSYLIKIHSNIVPHLRLGLRKGIFIAGLLLKF